MLEKLKRWWRRKRNPGWTKYYPDDWTEMESGDYMWDLERVKKRLKKEEEENDSK